jgi:twinkle protein
MIEWSKIDLSGKRANSKGEVKTLCPNCSHTRKKKKDPCLSVNIETGVGKCWNCEEKTIRETKSKKITYDLPPQQWENFTSLSDKVVKWFSSRGISQRTLIDCRVTEEKYYQPQLNKEVNNIVFNYFYGITLLNKKFRSAEKAFTQCKNAKKVFYGINDLEGETECYIVEGEMDKLSLWEVGIKNCISVPNGANDLNDVFETCGEELKKIEKFYIAVDNDEAGKKLEKALINRLGKWKCSRIDFENGKDANDELQHSKLSLEDCLNNPIDYPVEGTFTAADVWDDILDLYRNGEEETIKPKAKDYDEFNQMFSILMGQLTTVTGIPSSGKSNFIEDYVLNLISDYDYLRASFFSPEHLPMRKHHEVLSEKVVGKKFGISKFAERMNEAELEKYKEWSKDKIYLTAPDKGELVDWDWLLERFKEQCFKYGCNIFIIDAFNKVKRKNGESLAEIGEILARLTAFVQSYDVHVFLIAHPTKMRKVEGSDKYEIPDLYSVKGSGDFRDQTHNGLAVHRDYETGQVIVKNLKAKFKNQGSGNIGQMVTFSYDLENGRYYNGTPNRDPYWNKGVKQEQIQYEEKESSIDRSRVNAMNRQSGYNHFASDESLLDDCPF